MVKREIRDGQWQSMYRRENTQWWCNSYWSPIGVNKGHTTDYLNSNVMPKTLSGKLSLPVGLAGGCTKFVVSSFADCIYWYVSFSVLQQQFSTLVLTKMWLSKLLLSKSSVLSYVLKLTRIQMDNRCAQNCEYVPHIEEEVHTLKKIDAQLQ